LVITDFFTAVQLGTQGLLVDVSNGDTGAGLAMDQTAETSLTLHDTVRHVHLAAESRQEEYDLR